MNKKAVWKTVLLSWYWTSLALFGMGSLLFIIGLLSRKFVSPAVFISVFGGFIAISLLTFIFSEIFVNLLMKGKVARREDYPNFIEVAEELFREKKVWVNPRLYILDLSVPNAMAYGMGFPGCAAIAITPKLYKLLDRDELKGVVGHELAHIRCKDVGLLTTIGLMTGSVEKLRKFFLSGKTALGKGPFAFIFAGILWFISKFFLGFLRAAISQERELAADALGASYMGCPDALIRALGKLSKTSNKSKKFVLSDLMVSHPGMDERIESLQSLKQGGNYKMFSKSAIKWNLGILAGLLLLFVLLIPKYSSVLIFQGFLLNWPYLATALIAGIIAWPMVKGLNTRRARRSITGLISLALVTVISWIAMGTFTDYLTYKSFAQFEQRTSMVASDPEYLRFTPRKIAFKDIENSITAATEEVLLDYTHPLITKEGFSYVSAITPDGLVPTLASDNPGFVFYNDKSGVKSKVKRIEQTQTYGLGELWSDNFWWPVYKTDWWASYETPHFLRLDPKNPEVFTAVVPRVKYKFLRIPYWAGVILVHADGKTEELTTAEALKDPRLKGQWIAPLDLMRDYVEHQNYAVGYISSFFRVPGKLEIDDVEGLNKFPFITRGADGRDYFVVATKAEGSGGGLFRMYFATADNLELSYYEFSTSEVVYGPNAALKRVFNIPGYNWYREDSSGSSGNMTAIEPVYIVRPGDEDNLFWKFSITTKDMTGISATALVSGSNLDLFRDFQDRRDFESWVNSNKPLHGEIVRELETATGKSAPAGLSLADQIRWHVEQIRVLTGEIK